MEQMFFNNWEDTERTIILTVMAYAAMVFLLRISGKRTLTKMNAFDFVVTIALGSALATVSLNKNVSLVDGCIAFALLIFLQAILTWFSVRSKKVKNLITSRPVMLLYKGEVLSQTMKKERMTLEEIYTAARKKGILNLHEIGVIVLETTGDLTIIKEVNQKNDAALQDVENYDQGKSNH
jgi:uncharacterized membrane protein YcaP (DUF421 family)